MKCPNCGATEIACGTSDVAYAYKCESLVLRQVFGNHCAACGGSVLDAATSRRVSVEMRALSKLIDAAECQRAIRRK